jgi:aerobic-type carbon monoxide dehydrogenase small subunit (CoxS/CutS family)
VATEWPGSSPSAIRARENVLAGPTSQPADMWNTTQAAPSAVTGDLTADKVTLDDGEIAERMSGNLCRCAAYAHIRPAIREMTR